MSTPAKTAKPADNVLVKNKDKIRKAYQSGKRQITLEGRVFVMKQAEAKNCFVIKPKDGGMSPMGNMQKKWGTT